MRRQFNPRLFRPNLETLEDRLNLTPTLINSAVLPGANSVWDFLVPQQAASIIADVDRDGINEVLVPGGNGNLYAYQVGAGNTLNLDKTYSLEPFRSPIHSTPVVVDVPTSVAPSGRAVYAAAENGRVFGWDGQSGALLPGWPQTVNYPQHPSPERDTAAGAIASGDLDRDGFPEIVVTSLNNEVTVFRTRDASVMWRFANDDTIFSSVAIGDLNRDGFLEVVLGGDSSASATYAAGGRINCLTWDGRREWVKRTDQVIWSSPVLADLTGTGYLNVIVGTGFFYGLPRGNVVYALDPQGNDLPGWPYVTVGGNTEGRPYSSPAIADLDGDGNLDVIISDGASRIHAINRNGQALPGWPIQAYSFAPGQELYASPIVADIDNDNLPDVVLPGGSLIRGFNRTGAQIWEFRDNLPHFSTAAVGQLRGDATWQLAYMSNGFSGGQVLSPSSLFAFDLGTTNLRQPWPQFRQNASNNVVSRQEGYSTTLITQLYAGALGRAVSQSELSNIWLPQVRQAGLLSPVIQGIVSSGEARARQIGGWYQLYLGRQADAGGLNNWQTVLVSGQTYASVQANIVGSNEAFVRAGNTNQTWVTFLYNKVLGRNPVNGEDAGWVNALNSNRSTRAQVAFGFFFSREYTENSARTWYQTFAGLGLQPLRDDHLAAIGLDLRRGRLEELVLADLLTSNGNYVDVQSTSTFIRALYQDVLERQAGPAELAGWIRSAEAGASLSGIARAIQTSGEANTITIIGLYRRLLRRTPGNPEIQPAVGRLNAGTRLADIVRDMVQSQEYFDIAGRDNSTFIRNIYTDLLDRPIGQSELNFWLQLGAGVRTQLPAAITGSEEYLRHGIDLNYFKYLRRFPDTPPDLGRLVIRGGTYGALAFLNAVKSGTDPRDIVTIILSSAEYMGVARLKAFYLGTGRWMDANLP